MLAAVPGNYLARFEHYNVCSDRCITFVGTFADMLAPTTEVSRGSDCDACPTCRRHSCCLNAVWWHMIEGWGTRDLISIVIGHKGWMGFALH